MKFISVSFKNFRQFKDQKIDLVSKNGKNVTIIYGSNHIGKTTFVKSLIWCLYANNDVFDTKVTPILNTDVYRYWTPSTEGSNTLEANVTIELEHAGFDYLVKTALRYQMVRNAEGTYVPTPKTSTPEQSVFASHGEKTQLFKGAEAKKEIEKILPADLSDYFFYDGEANSIDKIATRRELGRSVRGIMNFDARDKLIDLLKDKGEIITTFMQRKRSYDPEKKVEAETRRSTYIQEIEIGEASIEQMNKSLTDLKDQRDEISDKIEANKEADALQRDIVAAEKSIASLKPVLENRMNGLFDRLGDVVAGSVVALAAAKKVIQESSIIEKLSDIKPINANYPHVFVDAIEDILKCGVCVCGRNLENDPDIRTHLVELEKHLHPNDSLSLLSNLKAELVSLVEQARSAAESTSRDCQEVYQMRNAIEKNDDTIAQNRAKLNGFSTDISTWKNEYIKIGESIGSLKQKIATTTEGIDAKKSLLRDINDKINSLSNSDEFNAQIDLCIKCVNEIRNIAVSRRDKAQQKVVSELQTLVNETYKFLSGEENVHFEIDPSSFNVKGYMGQTSHLKSFSQAESGMRNLAFVSSLVFMASHREDVLGENDPSETSEPYPLVLDAPFSNFDKENISRACEVLPKNCSQLIITILDKDWAVASDPIQPYISQLYRLSTNGEATDSSFKEEN